MERLKLQKWWKHNQNKGFYYYKHRKDILVTFLPQKLCFKSLKVLKRDVRYYF